MKQKFANIVTVFIMVVYSVYAVGIDISYHKCLMHGTENFALYHPAECPCHHHHENENSCSCGTNHHEHDASNPAINDDSCVEFEGSYSIQDAYSGKTIEKYQPYIPPFLYKISIAEYRNDLADNYSAKCKMKILCESSPPDIRIVELIRTFSAGSPRDGKYNSLV